MNAQQMTAETSALAILQQSPFFNAMGDTAMRQMASQFERVTLQQGEPVFLENEVSNSIYFVETGLVEILRFYELVHQVIRIALIKPKEHFSEISVITGSHHGASAFAAKDCQLLVLSGDEFLKTVTKLPQATIAMLYSLANFNFHIYGNRSWTERLAQAAYCFDARMPQLLSLAEVMKFLTVPIAINNQTLQVASVVSGNKDFINYFNQQNPKWTLRISSISQQDFKDLFQLLKVDYNDKSSGKIVGKKFDKQLAHSKLTVEEALIRSGMFTHVTPEDIQKIAPFFEVLPYEIGSKVFTTGHQAEGLYLLCSGAVELMRPMSNQAASILSTVIPGTLFGEISLILEKEHSLDAVVTETSEIAILSRGQYHALLEKPEMSLAFAKHLALRLQRLNKMANLEFYDGDKNIDFSKLLHLLPIEYMEALLIVPLAINHEEITIGVVTPENEILYSSLHRHLPNHRVKIVVIQKQQYEDWLSLIKYMSNNKREKTDGLTGIVNIETEIEKQTAEILRLGLKHRASDIHIEPMAREYIIRYRVDGALQEFTRRLPQAEGFRLINKIKVLCAVDVAQHRIPQDGQLNTKIDDVALNARVSIMPTKFGENAVIRLIKPHQSIVPLNMLAADSNTIKALHEMTNHQQGVIIISGPTGSGKTTTLYSILSAINKSDINVVTIEDPIEANIPGITQIEINPATGLDFSNALKHVLRQDPDVIMAGEIRDAESAELAFHAALTGHLVLTTIHTNHSLDIMARLSDLSVSNDAIATGLIWAISQRLVRSLCSECKVKDNATATELQKLATVFNPRELPTVVMRSKGCARCHGTGFYDRIPVFEYWRNSPAIADVLRANGGARELQRAVEAEGFKNLVQFGFRMVGNGLTTFQEVEKTLFGLHHHHTHYDNT